MKQITIDRSTLRFSEPIGDNYFIGAKEDVFDEETGKRHCIRKVFFSHYKDSNKKDSFIENCVVYHLEHSVSLYSSETKVYTIEALVNMYQERHYKVFVFDSFKELTDWIGTQY